MTRGLKCSTGKGGREHAAQPDTLLIGYEGEANTHSSRPCYQEMLVCMFLYNELQEPF